MTISSSGGDGCSGGGGGGGGIRASVGTMLLLLTRCTVMSAVPENTVAIIRVYSIITGATILTGIRVAFINIYNRGCDNSMCD